MKLIDAVKLETILIEEQKSLVKTFNYAHGVRKPTQTTNELIKAKVMEAKIEVLTTIIEALQGSVIESGGL